MYPSVPVFKHARDKQLATCLLCRSVVKQPRLLECLHSFCEVCLVRHLDSNKLQSRKLVIACPSCHTETSLPRAGVTALPEDHVAEAVLKGSTTAPLIQVSTPPTSQQAATCQNCFKRQAQWKCTSCSASLLCDLCNTVVHVMQSKDGLGTVLLAAHYVIPLRKAVRTYTGNDADVMLPCVNHDKQEAVSFCVTCSEPVCVSCRQSLHHTHSLCPPSEAVCVVRDELKLRVSQLEEAAKTMRNDLHNSEVLKNNLLQTRAQLLEDLDTQHQQVKLAVDNWYKEQCAQVSLAFVSELNSVTMWNTQCSARHSLIESTQTYVHRAIEMEQWCHLLSFFCASKRRLKTLTQSNGLRQRNACSIPDISVSFTDVSSLQQQLGSVHIRSKSFDRATDQMCTTMNGGTNTGKAEGHSAPANNSWLPWQLNHWESPDEANTLPSCESDVSLHVAFRSSLGLGQHQVVSAKHVPLKMCLFPLDQSFSTRSEEDNYTLSTGGISLSHDGKQLVVTDRATHTVSVFDCEGRLCRQIKCQHTLMSPHSAIILINGDAVVACDSANGQRPLIVFDQSGSFKCHVDTEDSMQPSAVATNYLGTFVVYDKRSTCLHVFDSNTYRQLFRQPVDTSGPDIGNIWDSIAMTGAGSVFVSSFLSHRIDQFSSRLHRLAKYGSRGKDTGQLQGPAGLCIDTAGNVLVADSLNGRLQVLTRDGHMHIVAMKARAAVTWPVGVAMDDTGRTYVLEHDGLVKVFQYA
jgi:hypothetical protein